jgi:4-amino-4-deoxy-L-arabinose transferase-like glycosyltransferase
MSERSAKAWTTWLPALLFVGALALALRLIGIRTATELHIDEVTYSRIATAVASGEGVKLHGEAFNLHPPAFFYVLGGVIDLFGPRPDTVGRILDLRIVPAVIGTGTAMLLFTLVWKTAGLVPGVVAGVLYALDPFVIRFDTRLFLEAQTMFFVILGALLLTVRGVPDRYRAVVAGVAFGLAMLTKDTALYLTVLPMVLIALFVPELRRRVLTVAAIACSTYLAYLVVVLITGGLPTLLDEKTSGFLRLIGAKQETGFNQEGGGVTLMETLRRNIPLYGASYAVCGLGTLAALARLREIRRGTAEHGVIVLVAIQLCASAYLVYGVFIGTLEEQMFYFMAVPSLACVALALPLLMRRRVVVLRVAVVALTGLWLLASAGSWTSLRSGSDDTYLAYERWAERNLPEDAKVAVTEEIAQFVQRDAHVGEWATPQAIKAENARYALISTRLIEDGFGLADADLEQWLDRNGQVVFEAQGRTLGELRLYQLDDVMMAR